MAGGVWGRLWRDIAVAPEFYRERRAHPLETAQAVAEPILSVTLVTTLVVSAAAFLSTLLPLGPLTGLPLLVLVWATIGFFYGRRLQWSGVLWREWLVLLAPAIVLWRIMTVLTGGTPPGPTLANWLVHPSSIVDGPFAVGTVLLLVAWSQGVGYGRDLAALHPGPMTQRVRPDPNSRDYWEEDERRRGIFLPAPSALATRWLSGGVALVVLSGFAALGVDQVLNGRALMRLLTLGAPDQSEALPNVLAYFVAGLVLVGLAQSSRLRANWATDGIATMAGLSRHALGGLAALVTLALAIGILLPTQYSLGLGDALQAGLGLVTYALAWIASLAIALVALAISLLDALLGRRPHAHSTPAPAAPPPLAAHTGSSGALGSLLFWLVALLVLAYCGTTLWRQAEGRVPALAQVRAMARRALGLLARFVLGVVRGARRGAVGVVTALQRWVAPVRAATTARIPRPSLRHMSPREIVAYLYLSVEERARRAGVPRQKGQTATEYSRELRRQIPDLDPDLSGLTELFLEARYSPHPFESEQLGVARSLWQRVRARLRARR